LRTDKNYNFKFPIKFLMTLDRSYIGYLGFLGIDLFKSVLMYSNGAICLIKLLYKMGLFTVWSPEKRISLVGPLGAWLIPEFLEAVGGRIVELFGKIPVEVHTVSIMPTFPVHKPTTNRA
jgi:hypothetical protein